MIIKGTLQHAEVLSELGAETFYSAHKDSAPATELTTYMGKIYSLDAITKELSNPENIYHIIKHESTIAGFSKMELNMKHPAIEMANVSKMDQIYLLDSFQGLKLGAKLLSFNIEYSKSCGQNGMWLVVWVGNTTAITFYEKFGFHIVTRDDFHLTDTHINPCYIMLLKYESIISPFVSSS
ncbi:MAG TPA: GNAT family N-acetyltransferase [Chitinophagaceae bacterium]